MSQPRGIGPCQVSDTDNSCPSCGATEGIRTLAPHEASHTRAWACDACGMNWATSYVSPGPPGSVLVTDLGVLITEVGRLRWLLGQVATLAEQESTLTDAQLRSRLRVLADLAGPDG